MGSFPVTATAVISCILQQHFLLCITGRHKAVKASEVLRFVFFVQVRSAAHYYQQRTIVTVMMICILVSLRFAVYLYACKSIKY